MIEYAKDFHSNLYPLCFSLLINAPRFLEHNNIYLIVGLRYVSATKITLDTINPGTMVQQSYIHPYHM